MLFFTVRSAYSVELPPKPLHILFPQSVLSGNLIPLTSKDIEKKNFLYNSVRFPNKIRPFFLLVRVEFK